MASSVLLSEYIKKDSYIVEPGNWIEHGEFPIENLEWYRVLEVYEGVLEVY